MLGQQLIFRRELVFRRNVDSRIYDWNQKKSAPLAQVGQRIARCLSNRV